MTEYDEEALRRFIEEAVAGAGGLEITREQAEAILRGEEFPGDAVLSDSDVARMLAKFNKTMDERHPHSVQRAPIRTSLAADDSAVRTTNTGPTLFSLGTISIDGEDRELLTDGGQVFVCLRPGERRAHILFDDKLVALAASADGMSTRLISYGRAKVRSFIKLMLAEPGQHSVRWVADETERGL